MVSLFIRKLKCLKFNKVMFIKDIRTSQDNSVIYSWEESVPAMSQNCLLFAAQSVNLWIRLWISTWPQLERQAIFTQRFGSRKNANENGVEKKKMGEKKGMIKQRENI